jgi:hypothetical protein
MIMEKARSMLSGGDIEHQFWVEKIYIKLYLINE